MWSECVLSCCDCAFKGNEGGTGRIEAVLVWVFGVFV